MINKKKYKDMTLTKGNIIIEEINIGDIHYEYESGICIKCEVLTRPVLNENGNWFWQSKHLNTSNVIDYLINPKYPWLSPKLYDYEAYKVKHYI